MTALLHPMALAESLSRGQVRVIDVQYALLGPPSRELYAVRHLPGAAHLALEEALAGPPGVRGRHPLPDPTVLEEALRVCGVDDDSEVVVYDQGSSLAAGRAWWVLRWAGHPQVRVLDGGLAAWERAGLPVTTEAVTPNRGAVRVRPGSVPVLTSEDAAHLAAHGTLLDVRAAERFRGEVEPIDAVAGHIPGSTNLPMSALQHDDGTFRSAAEIRAVAASIGVHRDTPLGTTCGSGVTASQAALAFHEAGITAIPYIGSWSEWITDPNRPVATGAESGP